MIKGIIFDLTGVLLDEKEEPVKENLPLLKELHGRYKIGILSNRGSFEKQKKSALAIYHFVEAVSLSGETGFAKPQKESYEDILLKLDLSPAETVFIDDLQENVEGALRVGIWAIHYRDPSQLRKELQANGVQINLKNHD